ncbi:MAG: hypothetical protein IT306_15160 [Chloroflexi bacterium]|nr:hypothetical protein [Chloroflexota bacterium]
MSRVRLLMAALFALLLSVQTMVSVPVALGQTETAQNPDLSVSLAVQERAAQGETVAATISIVNNSARLQTIVVKGVWLDPTGDAAITTRNGLLLPGQTVTRTIDYVVNEKCVPGIHELTVSVEGRGGASSAKAAVEIL